MHEFDVRHHARDHDDVQGACAHDLIGDVDVAAERVTRLGQYEISHPLRLYKVVANCRPRGR